MLIMLFNFDSFLQFPSLFVVAPKPNWPLFRTRYCSRSCPTFQPTTWCKTLLECRNISTIWREIRTPTYPSRSPITSTRTKLSLSWRTKERCLLKSFHKSWSLEATFKLCGQYYHISRRHLQVAVEKHIGDNAQSH